MTERSGTKGWYDDSVLVRSLPWHMRAYATFSRKLVNRQTGLVPGGSFLFRMQRSLTPILRFPRETCAQVGEHSVFVDLTDQRCLWVFDELRGTGDEYRIMTELIKAGDTFLDVGANHGSYSILAASLVGPGGLVVAIEPQPRLARLLERSLERAGAAPFQVHAVAAGDADGETGLHIPIHGSGSASRFAEYLRERRTRTIHVPLRKIDSYLGWRHFPGRVFMKLDVEGSELALLRGAQTFVREQRPTILLELNPVSARAAGYDPEQIIALLTDLGYSRFAELDSFPVTVTPEALDTTRQRNLLALSEER